MEEKFHYFLVAGEVTYLVSDDKGNDHVNRVMMNTLAPLEQEEITLKAIGAMQQGLQRQLFSRTGSPEKVLDVVIMNISYLGHMTKNTFGTPEDASKSE